MYARVNIVARKPKIRNYKEADGSTDYEAFEEDMGTYEDLAYDEAMDERDMPSEEKEDSKDG